MMDGSAPANGAGGGWGGSCSPPGPHCPSQHCQGAAAMPTPRSRCQGASTRVPAAGTRCRPGSSRNGWAGSSGEIFTARSNRPGCMERQGWFTLGLLTSRCLNARFAKLKQITNSRNRVFLGVGEKKKRKILAEG